MTRREFLATSTAVPALAAARRNTEEIHKPSILVIHADDYAYWGVGAYENKDVYTPNLDAMARSGALFSRAFASTPVCSPARATLMTGLDSIQHGIKDWIRPKEGIGLDPKFPVFPELLQRHGYSTAYIGKWHLGDESQFHPLRRGFDHFMGFLEGGNSPKDPTLEENGKSGPREGWLVELLTDNALSWIEQHRAKPFFCMVSHREPHAPFRPVSLQDEEPYRGKTLQLFKGSEAAPDRFHDLLAQYYACCTAVDRSVGQLLAKLKTLGIAENTVVIFTGDNGYMIGQHGLHSKGNAHFVAAPGNCRPNMFDPSVLVPLLMRWPAVIKPGTRIAELVGHIDFFATFCDLADVPELERPKTESCSLLPLLKGEAVPWRDAFLGSYDQYQYEPAANLRMVRTGRWKLVRNLRPGGEDELYDLQQDPDELINLAQDASARTIREQLAARLEAWQRRINDPLLKERA